MKCQDKTCYWNKDEYLPPRTAVHCLNMQDTLRTEFNTIQTYDRVTTYKCDNGHISKVKSEHVVDLAERLPRTRDTSGKRFHRKGYTRHLTNPAKQSDWRRDGLTNHQRHSQVFEGVN